MPFLFLTTRKFTHRRVTDIILKYETHIFYIQLLSPIWLFEYTEIFIVFELTKEAIKVIFM